MYSGEWRDDFSRGDVEVRYLNGDVYNGEVKELKRNGTGVFKIRDGVVQKGEFENDELMGKARIVYLNGNVLIGEFVKGKINGKAKLEYKS